MSVVDLVQSIIAVDVSGADTDGISAVLREVRSVRNWLDSVDVACARRLRELAVKEPAMLPEAVAAEAGRVSLRESTRRFDRATTVETIPQLGAVLEAGAASGAHVDAVTGAMRGLTADQKQRLADRGSSTPEPCSPANIPTASSISASTSICRSTPCGRWPTQLTCSPQ